MDKNSIDVEKLKLFWLTEADEQMKIIKEIYEWVKSQLP